MPSAEKVSRTTDVFLKEHLLYVITKAEAGEYADAMAALQETLSSSRDNVYMLAVEKQLMSLLDLSRRNILTEERRTEILDPISGIIERALDTLPRVQPGPADRGLKGQLRLEDALSVQEKHAAIDRLKVSYFERAGQHLTNGQYELALAEIRRVFVIEPDNATAQQYESIILELMRLKGPTPLPMQPTISARGVVPPTIAHRAPVVPAVQPVLRVHQEPPPAPPIEVHPQEPAPVTISNSDLEFSRFSPPVHHEPLLHVRPEFTMSADAPAVEIHEIPSRHRRYRTMLIIGALLVSGVIVAFLLLQGSADTNTSGSAAGTVTSTAPTIDKTAEIGNVVAVSDVQPQAATNPSTPVKQSRSQEASLASVPMTRSIAVPPAGHLRVQTDGLDASPVADELPSSPLSRTSETPANPTVTPAETPSTMVTVPEPEEFVSYEKDPQVVQLVRPTIPDNAWQGNSEMQIVVRVMIDADGKPVKVKFLKGDSPIVQTAITAAIMKSTFTPGIMGKAPVVTWLTVPLKVHREN